MNSNKRWTAEDNFDVKEGDLVYSKHNGTICSTPTNEWREKIVNEVVDIIYAFNLNVTNTEYNNLIKELSPKLRNLLDQHSAHLVERILKLAPGLENTQTGEVTYDLGVQEYMARIKAIDIVKDKQ